MTFNRKFLPSLFAVVCFFYTLTITSKLSEAKSSQVNLTAAQKALQKPDIEYSARFLPLQFEALASQDKTLFRKSMQAENGQVGDWSLKGSRIVVSPSFARRVLGGKKNPPSQSIANLLADYFHKQHGLSLQAIPTAFASYVPNDSMYAKSPQWALHNPGETFPGGAFMGFKPVAGADINVEPVWDKFSGADTLVIAVIDAGIDFNHPELKGHHWINKAESLGKPGIDDDGNGYIDDSLGWDFVDNDNNPQDYQAHGTVVSSVIAANFDNEEGMTGVLAEVKIMPVRVLDAGGHGDQAAIARGIQYAVNNGAMAINFSIGGNGDILAMRNAFAAARNKNIPIIVAAGNNGLDINTNTPAPISYNYENTIVVAAFTPADTLSGFSNYGKNVVHLAAPGEMVATADIPARKILWSDWFNEDLSKWVFSNPGDFALSLDNPIDPPQCIIWKSGKNTTMTMAKSIDLTNQEGTTLYFQVEYTPANTYDNVVVEASQDVPNATWQVVAALTSKIMPARMLSYSLEAYKGSKILLRFRTVLNNNISVTGRALKIDGLSIKVSDPALASTVNYVTVSGTSVAAPLVTAYVALHKLACDRMGITWTRAKALEGITQVPAYANKTITGGRLNMAKGLDFYLQTLPNLVVQDSTHINWKSDEKIEYNVGLSNPALAANYIYASPMVMEGLTFDASSRKLIWTPKDTQRGSFNLRFKALGTTTLRARVNMTVTEAHPVAVRPTVSNNFWKMGKQMFLLPNDWSQPKAVKVIRLDGLGRSNVVFESVLDAGQFESLKHQSIPTIPGQFYRVWINGKALAPH